MNINALAQQIGGKWTPEANAAKEQLANEFGRRNGWRQARRGFTLRQLSRRSNGRRRWDDSYPGGHVTDHAYYYRESKRPFRPSAIACHPYNWPHVQPEVEDVCDRFGLSYDVIADFPSWWLPGATQLIVFKPKE